MSFDLTTNEAGNQAYDEFLDMMVNKIVLERKLGLENYCKTPILDYLLGSEIRESQTGGKVLTYLLATTPVERTRAFLNRFGVNQAHTFSANDIPSNMAELRHGWAHLATPLVIDEIEANKANTPAEEYAYYEAMISPATADAKESMAKRVVYGTGSVTVGGTAVPDLVGLRQIIAMGGTAHTDADATTYGGLPRRYFPNLIGQVWDAGDVGAASASATGADGAANSTVLRVVTADITGTIDSTSIGKWVTIPTGTTSQMCRVVHVETSGSDTLIWLDQYLMRDVSNATITVTSAYRDASEYGAAGAFDLRKLDEVTVRTDGLDVAFTSDRVLSKIVEASRAQSLGITEEERRTIGVKGTHKRFIVNGVSYLRDTHGPTSEIMLLPSASSNNADDGMQLKFRFLNPYSDMKFSRNKGAIQIWNGGYVAAMSGYQLLNVCGLHAKNPSRAARLVGLTNL